MRRRKNIMIKRLITLGIASLMTAMLMSAPSFADNVLLKVPVWFPTRLPALGTNGPWIAERINKIAATAGSGLQVKIYEPGKHNTVQSSSVVVWSGPVCFTISAKWVGRTRSLLKKSNSLQAPPGMLLGSFHCST